MDPSAPSAMSDDSSASSFSSSPSSPAAKPAPKRRFFTGRSHHVCRDLMEIISPFQDGLGLFFIKSDFVIILFIYVYTTLVSDWEAIESLWDFALNRFFEYIFQAKIIILFCSKYH